MTNSIPHTGLCLGLEGCGLGLGLALGCVYGLGLGLVLSGLVNIPDIDGGSNACSTSSESTWLSRRLAVAAVEQVDQ